jgi:hypothetical protein
MRKKRVLIQFIAESESKYFALTCFSQRERRRSEKKHFYYISSRLSSSFETESERKTTERERERVRERERTAEMTSKRREVCFTFSSSGGEK